MPDTGPDNRAKGALIGLAIGDALGAPVEFQPRGGFAPIIGMRAGGRFRLPAGAWTDDTAMALCLAESLLANPDLDERDLLERFCRWAQHGENSSTGVAVGIGQITLRRLGDFRRTGSLHAAPRSRGDGNGALMRVAPVAIRHFRDPRKAAEIAIRQSRTTHASVLSEQCCAFSVQLISRLVLGEEWSTALAEAQVELQAPELLAMLDRCNSAGEPPSTGYVVDTLEAALWAVSRTQSFEEALLAAVNLGHDADTVGAVAGQIAGARYGSEAIPVAWAETLVQRARIEKLADLVPGCHADPKNGKTRTAARK
ncbi:ADP-ribosylglycohydrolase family protein [Paracoccus alcaliphilus]|nr:ADP-ribosylglycohydrolase family protein [Paracoccus alcaliphilus]WCR17353.1 ADP-ribosylglycohydrolase family protein [Paracoccus alcaliphilus]